MVGVNPKRHIMHKVLKKQSSMPKSNILKHVCHVPLGRPVFEKVLNIFLIGVSINVWGIVVQCDIQTELHGSVFYNGITLLRCFV